MAVFFRKGDKVHVRVQVRACSIVGAEADVRRPCSLASVSPIPPFHGRGVEALEAAVETGRVADLRGVEHEGRHDALGVEENSRAVVETHSEQRVFPCDHGAVQRADAGEHSHAGRADAHKAHVSKR